jgi:hypothetical protein
MLTLATSREDWLMYPPTLPVAAARQGVACCSPRVWSLSWQRLRMTPVWAPSSPH